MTGPAISTLTARPAAPARVSGRFLLADGSSVTLDLHRPGAHAEEHGTSTVVRLANPMGWPCTDACVDALLRIAGGADVTAEVKRLGSLEDGAILIDRARSRIVVVRGGSSKQRLYHRLDAGGACISDEPRATWPALAARADILAFFAAGSLFGPFEMRWTLETCWSGVHCTPAGTAVELQPASRVERRWEVIHDDLGGVPRDAAEAARRLRDVVDRTVERAVTQAHGLAFEISGGIDSSIVASRALAACARLGLRRDATGISITYPYYEFRREGAFIDDVHGRHRLRRASLDGARLLPFATLAGVPEHPEPNLSLVGMAQHEAMLGAAAAARASVLFHGFGGDTIFGMGPAGQFRVPQPPHRPEWIARRGWSAMRDHWDTLSRFFGSGEESSYRQFFSGAYIDDGWADGVLAPRSGVVRRCAFTDPDVLRLAARLWRDRPPDARYKEILRTVFADDLPPSVRDRAHKTAYDGLYVRGYRAAATALESLIAGGGDALADAGIDPPRLAGEVRRIAAGDLGDDRLVASVLVCLRWLEGLR